MFNRYLCQATQCRPSKELEEEAMKLNVLNPYIFARRHGCLPPIYLLQWGDLLVENISLSSGWCSDPIVLETSGAIYPEAGPESTLSDITDPLDYLNQTGTVKHGYTVRYGYYLRPDTEQPSTPLGNWMFSCDETRSTGRAMYPPPPMDDWREGLFHLEHPRHNHGRC